MCQFFPDESICSDTLDHNVFFAVKLTFVMLTVRGNIIHFRLTNGCSCESVEVFETENVSTWEGLLNLRIHAECSNHLSYQGQTFAAPCFEH